MLLPRAGSRLWFDVEFRVLGNDGSELLGKCVTVTVKSLGKASTACSRHNYSSGSATGTGSKYGAVYRDGSASVDPVHALVVDNSDEVWSVGGLDYLPSEGFGQ